MSAKIARILELLSDRPMTAHELGEALPISKRHAQGYLNHLMGTRQVHISRWVREVEHSERMYPRPVYKTGRGRNAPQPAPLDLNERKVRAWERVKADPERYVNQLLKQRKYRADRRAARPDKAAAWITPVPANDEMQEAA